MKKLFALLMVSATLFVVACNNATEEAATEEVVTEDKYPGSTTRAYRG
jgi:hypothetical protein